MEHCHAWPRARLVCALVALAGCGGGASGPSAEERAVAETLALVLRLDIGSVTCAEGKACTVRAAGHEPFQVEVREATDGGERWQLRPAGHRNIEYQLAMGLFERVRARPESVSCPPDGDVSEGFSCQISMPGGVATRVDVSAGTEPERFVWTAPELLMPAAIEERIAAGLREQGRDARVDCGSAVRMSVPGASFECVIAHVGGGSAVAAVSVMDRDGHVSYRIIDGAPVPGRK